MQIVRRECSPSGGEGLRAKMCVAKSVPATTTVANGNPFHQACGEDMSEYEQRGRLTLFSVYSDCPGTILGDTVPNSTLGRVSNLQDVASTLTAYGRGDNEVYSAGVDAGGVATVIPTPTAFNDAVIGIWFKVAFKDFLKQSITLRIAYGGTLALGGDRLTGHAFNFDLEGNGSQPCGTINFLCPFPTPQDLSPPDVDGIWGPEGSLKLTGDLSLCFLSVGGFTPSDTNVSVSASWIGPHSRFLINFAAEVYNNGGFEVEI